MSEAGDLNAWDQIRNGIGSLPICPEASKSAKERALAYPANAKFFRNEGCITAHMFCEDPLCHIGGTVGALCGIRRKPTFAPKSPP